MKVFRTFLLIFFIAISFFAQDHNGWSYNLNIYEVNTRQYTSSGTFDEFRTHLDRLEEMGVGIIWFMPVNPIGEQNRLGSLGSPYSVKDYLAVNPEFGDANDFRELVDDIHSRGMYVIIDWVANHTSWDNVLTTTHPEWYVTDGGGNFTPPPGTNWSDVIQLDYNQTGLRNYMIDAMKYWITEFDIDGFRCDAVSFMPDDFWAQAISQLKAVKPELFMLAEDDGTQYQSIGFDMSYAWGMHAWGNGVLVRIVNGTNTGSHLSTYIQNELSQFNDNHYRMYFTSNHDENAWHGTVFEQFGDAAEQFAVLTATVNSMQLIYGGQEAGLNKRLQFFDKDLIPWQTHPFEEIYKTLLHLKKENKALWNGSAGGFYRRVYISGSNKISPFVREKDNDKIFAIFNLSADSSSALLNDTKYFGEWVNAFEGDTVTIDDELTVSMGPWEYVVYKMVNNSTGVAEEVTIPSGFRLYQNYPNPFNPETTVKFDLASGSVVRIEVYNITGERVDILRDGYFSAGTHSLRFSGERLTSGTYFCRLIAKSDNGTQYTEVIPMQLLK